MVGPYKITMNCVTKDRDGMKSLHGYIAANQAADTYLPVDTTRPAKATDLQSMIVGENVDVIDIVCSDALTSAPTSGVLELFSNGKPTGITIEANTFSPTNVGRPKIKIPLGATKTYSWYVRTLFPA